VRGCKQAVVVHQHRASPFMGHGGHESGSLALFEYALRRAAM
jgi:hypothetical protein